MIINSGAEYDDFEALVDTFDASLTLTAVFYLLDGAGSNVVRAWGFLNSDNGDTISVISSIFAAPPSAATFTGDFGSAVSITQPLEVT